MVKYFIYSGFENFYGEKYLIEKLKERHIDDNIIQSELENYNKEMWLEKCSNFIEKKFGKDLSNLKPTRIFSCVKTVYNRGYDLNTIQIVLKDKRVNSEILETLENI